MSSPRPRRDLECSPVIVTVGRFSLHRNVSVSVAMVRSSASVGFVVSDEHVPAAISSLRACETACRRRGSAPSVERCAAMVPRIRVFNSVVPGLGTPQPLMQRSGCQAVDGGSSRIGRLRSGPVRPAGILVRQPRPLSISRGAYVLLPSVLL